MEIDDTTNPPRSFPVIIDPCDQGQHGHCSCGACGNELPEQIPKKCPKCDVLLVGTKLSAQIPSSDF